MEVIERVAFKRALLYHLLSILPILLQEAHTKLSRIQYNGSGTLLVQQRKNTRHMVKSTILLLRYTFLRTSSHSRCHWYYTLSRIIFQTSRNISARSIGVGVGVWVQLGLVSQSVRKNMCIAPSIEMRHSPSAAILPDFAPAPYTTFRLHYRLFFTINFQGCSSIELSHQRTYSPDDFSSKIVLPYSGVHMYG